MSRLDALIEEFCDVKKINPSFEGTKGVQNLETLIQALGYDDLSAFLQDNSSACQALVEWIGNANISDWEDNIESHLPEREEEDEDDDEEGYSDPDDEDEQGFGEAFGAWGEPARVDDMPKWGDDESDDEDVDDE